MNAPPTKAEQRRFVPDQVYNFHDASGKEHQLLVFSIFNFPPAIPARVFNGPKLPAILDGKLTMLQYPTDWQTSLQLEQKKIRYRSKNLVFDLREPFVSLMGGACRLKCAGKFFSREAQHNISMTASEILMLPLAEENTLLSREDKVYFRDLCNTGKPSLGDPNISPPTEAEPSSQEEKVLVEDSPMPLGQFFGGGALVLMALMGYSLISQGKAEYRLLQSDVRLPSWSWIVLLVIGILTLVGAIVKTASNNLRVTTHRIRIKCGREITEISIDDVDTVTPETNEQGAFVLCIKTKTPNPRKLIYGPPAQDINELIRLISKQKLLAARASTSVSDSTPPGTPSSP